MRRTCHKIKSLAMVSCFKCIMYKGKCLQILQHGNNIHMGKWNPSNYHRKYVRMCIYYVHGTTPMDLCQNQGAPGNDLSSFGDQEIIFVNTVATNHLKASGHMFESLKLLNIFWLMYHTLASHSFLSVKNTGTISYQRKQMEYQL